MNELSTSAEIDKLAAALAKAQRLIEHASKAGFNPHFKSRYADLASVWEAIREPLSSNGLSVVQAPRTDGRIVTVDSILMHESGQFIKSSLSVTAQQDTPQAIGSAITYIRRYSLQSIAGIAPDDDDGNAASAKGTSHAHTVKTNPMDQAPTYSKPIDRFDPTSKSHLEFLLGVLKKKDVPNLEVTLKAMSEELAGKPFTNDEMKAAWQRLEQKEQEVKE